MSAISWNLPMRSRTFDVGIPVVGFAAGLALLIAFGSPSRAAGSRHSVTSGGAGGAAPRMEPAGSRNGDQGRTGALLGVVLDGHGDPVPGAQVRVLDEDGTTIATTHAGAGDGALSLGEFRVDELPAGVYQVAASLPGNDSEARARVPVASFEDTRVRLHLDLGY